MSEVPKISLKAEIPEVKWKNAPDADEMGQDPRRYARRRDRGGNDARGPGLEADDLPVPDGRWPAAAGQGG